MAYEDIFEPIEVITHFQGGKIMPLRFLWNGRTYKVKRVNTRWKERLGNSLQLHFSINSDGPDCFELIFDTSDFSWQIARVYLEG